MTKKPLSLAHPLHVLGGVGERTAALLAQRGLRTIDDLLRYLPRRYEIYQTGTGDVLAPGQRAIVEGRILQSSSRLVRGRPQVQALLQCGPSTRVTLMWFRVPGGPAAFLRRFAPDTYVRASGKLTAFRDQLQIVHPETTVLPAPSAGGAWALPEATDPSQATSGHTLGTGASRRDLATDDDACAVGDIRPVYTDIEGVRPAVLRHAMVQCLTDPGIISDLSDPLPSALRERHGWPGLADALLSVHRPAGQSDLDALNAWQTPAQQRLIYDKLLLLQLALLQHKRSMTAHRGHILSAPEHLTEMAKGIFPFALTDAQQRVLHAIDADLRTGVPMHRLVQGDVGCGKTAVALSAAARVAKAGLQTALLAPTELLAEQHARGARRLLEPHGISVGLLVGGMSAPARRTLLADLAAGRLHVVVGTHALIQQDVRYHALALAIIDEQHRFGVLQRARLLELGHMGQGHVPHMLVMTATPIPRTLALTAYGDLDVSVIDALPPGRTPVTTRVFKESDRERVYDRVRQAVQTGRQAYVVFPLVDESDKEGITHLRAATTALQELREGPLAGLSVGLLHGRMGGDEKEQVMQAFLRQDISVLIATTVIEVGIDVPNATVMVIENAERFGLSQLHQLRGRVGRGSHQSGCALIAGSKVGRDGWHRLLVMQSTQDGFRIAEADLALRGPGDFIGTRQAGMPTLALADLVRDADLLAVAREDAAAILAVDPNLTLSQHVDLKRMLYGTWQHKFDLAQIA